MNLPSQLMIACGALFSFSYLSAFSGTAQAVESVFFSNSELKERVDALNPESFSFIKDKPILVFEYQTTSFDTLPKVIANNLTADATMDRTGYDEDHLETNKGGAIALQMDGKNPDFYIIGKDVYQKQYKTVSLDEFQQKNEKSYTSLSNISNIEDTANRNPEELKAVLKTKIVPMIKLSDLGISISQEVTIESPWGEQTKPQGKDAYLVYNAKKDMYYMVNTNQDGLPSNYAPASE